MPQTGETTSPQEGTPVPGLDALLNSFALIVSNHVSSMWLSESDQRDTVDHGYALLSAAMQACKELDLRVRPDGITVNGEAPIVVSDQIQALIGQLNRRDVGGFRLLSGLSREHFAQLMEILGAQPAELEQLGGLRAVIDQFKIENVRARNIVYREIEEDDIVISRKTVGPDQETDDIEQLVEETVRALRGSLESGSSESVRTLRAAMDKPGAMARAILEAAQQTVEGKQDAAASPAPDAVADRMRDAYEALLKDDSARTQKGKQQIRRSLKTLGEEMLRTADALPPEQAEALSEAVTATIEELTEAINIDAMAADYARKLKAIRTSEERLLKFMGRRGLNRVATSGLSARLEESGCERTDWQALLGRSGLIDGEVTATPLEETPLGRLATRVRETTERLESADDEQAAVEWAHALEAMDDAVAAVLSKTADRIEALRQEAEQPEVVDAKTGQAAQKERGLSSAKRMKILGEIVQEICQPLSVIQSCLFMMKGKQLGEMSESQNSMLGVVSDGVARILKLVDGLRDVTAEPKALSPDAEIISGLYKSE